MSLYELNLVLVGVFIGMWIGVFITISAINKKD